MLYWLIAAGAVALDRLTKWWAATYLREAPGGTLPIIQGALHLTYAENRGAAFGAMQGFRLLFLAVTVVAIAFIVWELWRKRRGMHRLYGISLGLILGGALGNFIDRLFFGYVVDFVDFRLINFAIFNVADTCLNIGVALACIWMLFIAEKRNAPV